MFVLLFPVDCPLKTAPRFSRRLLHSRTLCNFPCHTPNCLCSFGMWWAVVLQRVAMKETQSDLKRKFRFFKHFLKMFFVLFSCLRFRHLLWDKYWSSVHREKVATTETVCSRLQPIMWQTKRKNTHNQKKTERGSLQICNLLKMYCQINF